MLIIVHCLILITEKTFLVLGGGPIDSINDGTVVEKNISIIFSRTKNKCCFIFHYNGNESYLYVNKTKMFKFKAKYKISWYNCCSGSILQDFKKDQRSGISLNANI